MSLKLLFPIIPIYIILILSILILKLAVLIFMLLLLIVLSIIYTILYILITIIKIKNKLYNIIKIKWILFNFVIKNNHSNNDTCSICLEPLKNNIIITKCNHVFHKKCIIRIINNHHNKCPLCRNRL